MSVELALYVTRIDSVGLPELLADPSLGSCEPVGLNADLSEVREVLSESVAGPSRADLALLDGLLVEPPHRVLPALPHRLAADMRFWQWLCVAELKDVVWHRWHGSVPDSPADVLAANPALSDRFLGDSTLHGVSRNALARLWWCAETLRSDQDGYGLARQALARQDLFQAIFERQFGLYPPVARTCLRRFGGDDVSEREWREGTRRLNHYLTTLVLESLSEDGILDILSG